ncbi:MAG: type II secretion system F family protein [Candidatus Paceibacterota bacterium]|jgi:type IV pilus assembly protein PilC
MLFSYKVTDKDGKKEAGTLDAADKFALYKELHARGYTVLSVSEKGAKKSWGKVFSMSIGGGSVKMSDRILFAKNLSSMLRAGLALTRALSVLERQVKNQNFKKILASLTVEISKGKTLSQALAEHPKIFSSLFVSMVAAGEESGSLAESLHIVGDQLEKSHNLKKKVRGAMMYPMIIIGLMLAIGVLMLVYVVPSLTQTFRELNVELPITTRIVIGVSDFLESNIVISLIGLIVIALGIYAASKSAKGRRAIDWFVLHIPIISVIVKQVNAARTARTLSSLLSSGVEVVAAIRITGEVLQNSYYKEILKKSEDVIQKGQPLSLVLAESPSIFPSFVSEMVAVGEETGKLSEMLLNVAIFYEEEVDQRTKDLSTVIEPFLMIIIGVGVGFFALAMISPIYSLSNSF